MSNLNNLALSLVEGGTGILASDESISTASKRLEDIGVESTTKTRRKWRQFLYTTQGIEDFISGVIMSDETIRQEADSGIEFPRLLDEKGIITGIKVDKGKISLPFSNEEKVTEGLDNLKQRLERYKNLGAEFAKWRGALYINTEKGFPSKYAIDVNSHVLARYAALCQEKNILPIVEPEVVMNGNHSIESCFKATKRTLDQVFSELNNQRVELDKILLKPNMVISGSEANKQSSAQEVANKTVDCFLDSIPRSVPAIVFLSGGQKSDTATSNLNSINQVKENLPWELSFSFGRALQQEALKVWQGQEEKINKAQEKFYQRAKLVSAAREGDYETDMESNM
jgi:fructose-bisphosphate aldolase class I